MDELVAYFMVTEIWKQPGVSDVQALSYEGRTDVYVELQEEQVLPDLAQTITETRRFLPEDCRLGKIERLPDGYSIPAPEEGSVDVFVIEVKEENPLNPIDVSVVDLYAAVQGLRASGITAGMSAEELAALTITVDGQAVILGDVAEVSVVQRPKCVARDLMGKQQP
jgi:hypothetical protein